MTVGQSSPDWADVAHARSSREALAYDEGCVTVTCDRWVKRVSHVVLGPNTVLGEQRFACLLGERVVGGSALDVGCATGSLSSELHRLGARTVLGFDVSPQHVEQARAEHGGLAGVTFAVHDAAAPVEGRFDVIAGRSILHHLDFRGILPRLFERNLKPGGRMVFMEPMSHPLNIAFHRLVRSAHTSDEWPLTPADAHWLRRRFDARILPINLLSFPAGVFSSFFLPSHDNRLMRLADRVDRSLERRRRVLARGRQGIVVIDRPPAAAS
jgi:2-polyprenyl-3-methyl-5-hydroxy-6-metoxy-1,4-benzoquinol methylase